MTDAEKLSRLLAAREEFVTRMQALNALSGDAFERTADALELWVSDTNEELDEFADEFLGERPAVNAEALFMLTDQRSR